MRKEKISSLTITSSSSNEKPCTRSLANYCFIDERSISLPECIIITWLNRTRWWDESLRYYYQYCSSNINNIDAESSDITKEADEWVWQLICFNNTCQKDECLVAGQWDLFQYLITDWYTLFPTSYRHCWLLICHFEYHQSRLSSLQPQIYVHPMRWESHYCHCQYCTSFSLNITKSDITILCLRSMVNIIMQRFIVTGRLQYLYINITISTSIISRKMRKWFHHYYISLII